MIDFFFDLKFILFFRNLNQGSSTNSTSLPESDPSFCFLLVSELGAVPFAVLDPLDDSFLFFCVFWDALYANVRDKKRLD